MTTVRYSSEHGDEISIELDSREVGREPGDIALSRAACIGLPIKLCILIRTTGAIAEWYAEWATSVDQNPYWHFDHLSDEYALGNPQFDALVPHAPTEGQRQAIATLCFGRAAIFPGAGRLGGVGTPVQQWCAWDSTEELEALGNGGRRGYYA
mgnify:FL=1